MLCVILQVITKYNGRNYTYSQFNIMYALCASRSGESSAGKSKIFFSQKFLSVRGLLSKVLSFTYFIPDRINGERIGENYQTNS